MTEEPTKLFATRAERYPEPTDADKALGGTRAALAMIPIAGGPINELLSLVVAPAVQNRRDQWFKELADGLEALEAKVEGFTIETLVDNEVFVSAVLQATRIAGSTHDQQKRRYLRDAVLKVALGKGPKEEYQQLFLNAVEEFTTAHIRVLKVLWRGVQDLIEQDIWDPVMKRFNITNYKQAIEALLPELKGEEDLIRFIMRDLVNRGLSRVADPEDAFPENPGVTSLGGQFLNFVLDAQDPRQ